MAARLKAAGYPDEDLRIFVPTGHPKEGGLLAVLHGSDPIGESDSDAGARGCGGGET